MIIKFILFSALLFSISCSTLKEPPLSNIEFEFCDTSYSFSLEPNSYTSHFINVIVKVSERSDVPRRYSLLITGDGDATSDDYTILSNFIIAPNQLQDEVKVILNRTNTLKGQSLLLSLRLNSNNYFRVNDKRSLQIYFNDVTIVPIWWWTWEKQFGEYYKEKLIKWKELYKEGLDPDGYYWNNMPPYAMIEYYPTTFLYLQRLKAHFDNNIIYPDGDKSKERLTIPLVKH